MAYKTIQTSTTNGMPSGIPFIIGNEAAERFSYYGMKAILSIFMTEYLMMTESQSNEWYHAFGSAVYFMPIFGALLADVFLGKYRTILTLSIIYSIGHLILATNETKDGLFWGLICISIGSGGIKPCVSAHVGDQFNSYNKHLIEKVFAYFYLAVNFGAFFSSLLIPYLLEHFGPAVAFGLPGLLMLFATFVFWLGRNHFVHIPPFGKQYLKTVFSKVGLSAIGRLSFIYLFLAVFWALYDQTGSTWVFQSKSPFIDKEFSLFGHVFNLLPSQIQAINPILVLVLIPLFSAVLYPAIHKIIPLKPLYKIVIGMLFGVLSYLIVAYIESRISQGIETSVNWQFFAYLLLTIAEVLISVTALEFSYTQAPNQMKSTIMGFYLFSVSLGNIFVAIISNYNSMPYVVKDVHPGTQTTLELVQPYTPLKGEKIEFDENSGISYLKMNADTKQIDTIPLAGTFFVGAQTSAGFVLQDNSLTNITTIKDTDQSSTSNISVVFHRFKQAAYFNMFAIIMLVTAILFFFVALKYKEKTYIQGEAE